MKIDLVNYLSERYKEKATDQSYEGPVITIAREFGCPAKKVAASLTNKLTKFKSKKDKGVPWRWISKEILAESAKALELDPSEIKYVFNYEKKTIFDDILSSHSKKYYKSDRKIRATVAEVIRNVASEGNTVILGRGGVAITRDIEKSLHIKLTAPIEWRVIRVGEKYCMNDSEAKKYILDIDKKRQEFRQYFHGKDSDYTRFDATYNCMTLSVSEIAESIFNLVKIRKLA
jgi:cytidylate kinase